MIQNLKGLMEDPSVTINATEQVIFVRPVMSYIEDHHIVIKC